MPDTSTDLVDRVLDALAARIISTCNHPEAGMQYPCCEDCWDKSRMVISQKHHTEGTNQ
jgi:hypothetical protein